MQNEIMDRALGIMPKDDMMLSGAVEDIARELPIGKEQILDAIATLKKYKDGKANLESNIVENEEWFKLRHWEVIDKSTKKNENRIEPASAWLFNSLTNKHADAMDNYPEPNVLPREQADKEDAESLSSIIPVVLERNEFEQTYSDAWWYKLKNGVVPYGVFWNTTLENGLGDVDIKKLDILNLFWQPGITDIQDSRNLFIVSLVDKDLLEDAYPQLKNKLGGGEIDVKQYNYDDTVDVSDKAVVVDWYYKKPRLANKYGISSGHILHYCKFVGSEILFASENEPEYVEGWYEHGMYPVVFDVLFPEEGTPYGFGFLSVMKDPQMYIDKLSQLILENAALASKPRYWKKKNVGINEEQFLDITDPIVEVEGDIDEEKLRPIDVPTMPGYVLDILNMKIDELKETSSNRDVSQGSSSGGVTAAAAIAALQEAGNKTSRDMISASYRAYTKICYLVIELIRQFYDESRSFRITGKDGKQDFVQFSNANIKGKLVDPAYAGAQMEEGYEVAMRKPIFDIVIRPQKRSAYSRLSQNELAKELYGLGLFNPENAEQAMITLDMMDFDGDEDIKQKVQQGQTLLNMVMQLTQQVQKLNDALLVATGGRTNGLAIMNGGAQMPHNTPQATSDTTGGVQQAQERTAMTNYGEKLARRARPNMGE